MIKQLQYYYNKNLYFYYLFTSIFIFLFLKNSNIINFTNIISILITLIIVYGLLTLHNNKIENNFLNYSEIYKNFNYDRYPHIKSDSDVILILSKINELYKHNPVEFRNLLSNIDNFLYLYNTFLNKNDIYKDLLYSQLHLVGKNIADILYSFSVGFNYSTKYINDLEVDPKVIETSASNFPYVMKEMKLWISRKLINVETKNNSKWLRGEINNNSIPIYPDDVQPNEYKLDNYNVF